MSESTNHENAEAEDDMLVIQFGDRTVKGFAEKGQWPPEQASGPCLSTLSLRPHDADAVEVISLDGVKAIFRVKSFEGKGHDDLRFHDHLPPADCLWVRVTFVDGEVMEGLMTNNHHHVLHAGFLMSPIDPEGNNWMVYVFKSKLTNFQVLGLRPSPRTPFGSNSTQTSLQRQPVS